MVTADPIIKETRTPVGLIVKVVRFGQLGQKPAAIVGERAAGEELLYSRSEPRRCVLRDSAKDRLTVGRQGLDRAVLTVQERPRL